MMFAMQNEGAAEPWLLGPRLSYDPVAGMFTGRRSDEANKKMTRDYRKNFEI